jgi:hypothetical protein
MLYSVYGRWMEYVNGALMEWYWQGKTELLGGGGGGEPNACHFPPQTPHGLEWDRNRDLAGSGESTDDCAQATTRIRIRQTTNMLHL